MGLVFIMSCVIVALWSTQVLFSVSLFIKKDMLVYGSKANLEKWKRNMKIQMTGVLIPLFLFIYFMVFIKN